MIRRVEDDLRSRARRLLDSVVPGERVRLRRRRGRRAADADDLHSAGSSGVRTTLAVRGHRAAASTSVARARRPSRGCRSRRPARGCTTTARNSSRRSGLRRPTTCSRSSPMPALDTPVTDAEVYLFFNLLFSAGAETTRNSVAGGLLALAEHPDQLAALRSDLELLPTAIEEMVRWTSPSPSKRRTATKQASLGGHAISPGDKVLVWEGSANRDAVVFADADYFDIDTKAESALGLRPGRALLPRREPGPAGAAGVVRGVARPVLVGAGGQTGGVDPEQPPHRYPASGGRAEGVKPDTFAAVMATGIVSIAALDHGFRRRQRCVDRAGGRCAAGADRGRGHCLATRVLESQRSRCRDSAVHIHRRVRGGGGATGRTPRGAVGARGDGVAGLAFVGAGSGAAHVARPRGGPARPRARGLGVGERCDIRIGDRDGGSEDRLSCGAVLGRRDRRVPGDHGTGCLAGHR